MCPLSRILLAALLVLWTATPGMAKLATIETSAPLADQSEQSVKAAIIEVVQTAARGALAMGLSWVKVNQVLVLDDRVQVSILATDVKPEEDPSNQEDQETLDGSHSGRDAPASPPSKNLTRILLK